MFSNNAYLSVTMPFATDEILIDLYFSFKKKG